MAVHRHAAQIICFAIGSIDLILETLILYMIVFKSPKAMSTFKVYLAALCLNNVSISLSLGWILQPQFLFPPICIYTTSVFKDLVSIRVMLAIFGVLITQFLQIMLLSYYYIYSQFSFSFAQPRTWSRAVVEVIFVLVPSLMMCFLIYYGNSSTEYVSSHASIDESIYPDVVCYFIGQFEDGTITYAVMFYAVYSVFFTVGAAFLVVKVNRQLRNPPSSASKRTIRLQRMFFLNVIVQCLCPFCFTYTPILITCGYLLSGSADNTLGDIIAEYTVISNNFNCVVSSLLIIWATKPYRTIVMSKFKLCKNKIKTFSLTV